MSDRFSKHHTNEMEAVIFPELWNHILISGAELGMSITGQLPCPNRPSTPPWGSVPLDHTNDGAGAERGDAVATAGTLAGDRAEGRRGGEGGVQFFLCPCSPRGPRSGKITGSPAEGQRTGKYSQTACTAEDLRKQLPCYLGVQEKQKELDWGGGSGLKGRKEVR